MRISLHAVVEVGSQLNRKSHLMVGGAERGRKNDHHADDGVRTTGPRCDSEPAVLNPRSRAVDERGGSRGHAESLSVASLPEDRSPEGTMERAGLRLPKPSDRTSASPGPLDLADVSKTKELCRGCHHVGPHLQHGGRQLPALIRKPDDRGHLSIYGLSSSQQSGVRQETNHCSSDRSDRGADSLSTDSVHCRRPSAGGRALAGRPRGTDQGVGRARSG